MTLNWKSKIILAKIEATYGVDANPTGADNAMLITEANFVPMEGEDVSRNLEFPYLAAQPMIPTGLRGRLTGKVELVPSGTAGTAPNWGPLLRMCGVAENITVGTSVAYNPISTAMESGTIHFWQGNTQYIITGSRGTATFQFNAQGIPYVEFDIMGLYTRPGEGVRPVPDLSGFQKPVIVTDANTPTFTINGTSLVMRDAALAMGNQVDPRLLVNSESIRIPDRADAFTTRVEAVPLTTFNPFALAEDQTLMPINLVHGTQAGTIVSLAMPSCQIKRPTSLENSNNIVEWPLEFTPLANSGNDQWTLTLT